jgi:hypothetical protein
LIMPNAATVIILTAGTMTFANEWYQTKKIDWKVPLATIIGAAAFDGLAHLDSKTATLLSVIVLLGASTTKFNGYSPYDTISELFSGSTNSGTITGARGGTGTTNENTEIGHNVGGRIAT